MPRPKVNADEKIKKAIPVKFSTTQIFRLKETARQEHLAVSTLIRKYVLERLNNK